jgi:hypothetical protein
MIVWGGVPYDNTVGLYCATVCPKPTTSYRDQDGDGYGNAAVSTMTCDASIPAGYVGNNTDCDDADPHAYPNAPEINDGKDNQCPGDLGYGLVDEISGVSGFLNPTDNSIYSWPAQFGATIYEVARSTSPDFLANCTTRSVSSPSWSDPQTPPTGVCFYYLVRALTPHAGSWGASSAGVEETVPCQAVP